MFRRVLFLLISAAVLIVSDHASGVQGDDGPPISITSPDSGTTFAYGSLKNHSLFWDKIRKVLIARVTFTDSDPSSGGQGNDDTHDFRLPGISFDAAKKVFYATTAKGEIIPVARLKKALFIESIEVMPNATIRILHPRGNLTVILEAISPDDPAMHQAPEGGDGTQSVDFPKVLN